jgi:hypothetical protein
MNRSEMRRCGRQYSTEEEALRSKAGQRPGAEVTSCRCGKVHLAFPPAPKADGKHRPAARLNVVSTKRQAANRERRAMADRRWPDRRDGTVMCAVSFCNRPADDLHEILPRGRGGSITDEENTTPTCRQHNGEITTGPDWAYQEGLIKHDGLCCRGRDVCSQYAEGGEAA